MSLANYAELKILDHITGKTSFTMPTIYVALFKVNPDEAGSLTNEVSGGDYARKQTAGSDWNAASGGSVSNVADITFVEASAGWGDVTHFALMDSAVGGTDNMIAYAALTIPRTISAGDTAKFSAENLVITID